MGRIKNGIYFVHNYKKIYKKHKFTIEFKMSNNNDELSSIDDHTEEESYESSIDSIDRLTSSLRGLNTRRLPNWDHNAKKRDSIREHLHVAKQLGQRLGWTNKELANEVMLSLRGESRTVARNFSDKILKSVLIIWSL